MPQSRQKLIFSIKNVKINKKTFIYFFINIRQLKVFFD